MRVATHVDHSSAYRGWAVAESGQPNRIRGSGVEVEVEVWTYNFGPNKLMERIRIEDGLSSASTPSATGSPFREFATRRVASTLL